jgi:hypothetical protein
VTGHGTKFGRKQEEAIAALLSKTRIEDVAGAVGISVRTLLRWLKIPEFAAAYREARRSVMLQTIGRLQQASTAAVATLVRIMLDPATPAAVRVRAADCVLAQTFKGMENEDIDARVSELERTAAIRNKCLRTLK